MEGNKAGSFERKLSAVLGVLQFWGWEGCRSQRASHKASEKNSQWSSEDKREGVGVFQVKRKRTAPGRGTTLPTCA